MSIFNPRQTVLVTSSGRISNFGKDLEKDNILAVDWHMPVSLQPAFYAISISKASLSYEMISSSKVFAVNFIPSSLEEEVIVCGRNSGRHMDKFLRAGLTKVQCEKIECVRIAEALAFIECEVVGEHEFGDHIIFVGRIVFSQKLSEGKRLFHKIKDEFTSDV